MDRIRLSTAITTLIVIGFLMAYVVMIVFDHKHRAEAEQIKNHFSDMVDNVFSISFYDHQLSNDAVTINKGVISLNEWFVKSVSKEEEANKAIQLISDKKIKFDELTFNLDQFPFPQSELNLSVKALSIPKEVLNLLILMNPSFFMLYELVDDNADSLVLDVSVDYKLAPESDVIKVDFSLQNIASINVEVLASGVENYRLKHQELSKEINKVDANLESVIAYENELSDASNSVRLYKIDVEYIDGGMISSIVNALSTKANLTRKNIAEIIQKLLDNNEVFDDDQAAERIRDLVVGTASKIKVTMTSPDGIALYQLGHMDTFKSGNRSGIDIKIR